MYIIFKQTEEGWVEAESSTLPLPEILAHVYELGKQNPTEVYRLEEVTEFGKTVINFS